MPTNAELTAQVAELTKRATDAEARVATLTTDLASANESADAEKRERQEAEGRADAAEEELRAANASLKAYKGSATKLRNQLTIVRRERSPEPRAIGAPKPAKTELEAAERAIALDAAFAGDTTELVFSDGRREIRELAPLAITGDAWREAPSRGPGELGRVLNSEIDLEPGDCQRETMELKGFALLNEAGEQVAYCQLPDAITIERNRTYRLSHNTIRF